MAEMADQYLCSVIEPKNDLLPGNTPNIMIQTWDTAI